MEDAGRRRPRRPLRRGAARGDAATAAAVVGLALGLAACSPRPATTLPQVWDAGSDLFPGWCDDCPAGRRERAADGSPALLVVSVPLDRFSPALRPGSQVRDAHTLLGPPLEQLPDRHVFGGPAGQPASRFVVTLDGERIGTLEWHWHHGPTP